MKCDRRKFLYYTYKSGTGLVATAALSVLPAHSRMITGWKYMEQTQIDWRSYEQQVFDSAAIHKRPLFVFIYADWCSWCRHYERNSLEAAPIRRRLSEDFIPIAVDYDKEKELAIKLGARLVPTTIILTPEGRKLVRFFGLLEPEDLSATIDRTLTKWRRGEIPNEEFGSEETCCPLP